MICQKTNYLRSYDVDAIIHDLKSKVVPSVQIIALKERPHIKNGEQTWNCILKSIKFSYLDLLGWKRYIT
jgi:hypothetical protein